MSIGLFVEGKSDKDTIPKLTRKLLGTSPKIIPRTILRSLPMPIPRRLLVTARAFGDFAD